MFIACGPLLLTTKLRRSAIAFAGLAQVVSSRFRSYRSEDLYWRTRYRHLAPLERKRTRLLQFRVESAKSKQ